MNMNLSNVTHIVVGNVHYPVLMPLQNRALVAFPPSVKVPQHMEPRLWPQKFKNAPGMDVYNVRLKGVPLVRDYGRKG